jgi:hypothetical protein
MLETGYHARMVEFEPYRPPRHDTQPASGSGEPLYTTQHVTLATFFGTPLAGFVLLGINESRMGRPEQRSKMIGLGVVASFVILVISLILPEEFPAFVLSLVYLLGMQALAKQWQGDEVMARLSNGTPKASGWLAFGIGLLCLLPFLVAGFLIGWLFPEWVL